MAIECAVCSGNISRYDDYVSCTGNCKSDNHIGCVKMTIEEFTEMKANAQVRFWQCNNCITSHEKSVGSVSPDDGMTCQLSAVSTKSLEMVIASKITEAITEITKSIILPLREEVMLLREEIVSLRNVPI